MKITAFYYLDYPDSLPPDPRYASTKMYVELGQDTSTIEDFSHTLAFRVYTSKYVEDNFFTKNIPLVERSLIIVPELTNLLMDEFLESNVNRLDEWGEII